MKHLLLTALSTLPLAAFALQLDNEPQGRFHQVTASFGQLQLDVNTDIKQIHIQGKKQLLGLQVGYEYLEPWAVYTGVELLSLSNTSSLSAATDEGSLDNDGGIGFVNLDLRVGYTLSSRHISLSPFLGLGVLSLGSMAHYQGFEEGGGYVSGGLRTIAHLTSVFSVGLNGKAMVGATHAIFKNSLLDITTFSTQWGGEISLPLAWNFTPSGSCTFQIEPWFATLPFAGAQTALGTKCLIGAHF